MAGISAGDDVGNLLLDDSTADPAVSLTGVDLNLLPMLHALLTERNVTRAAERMSIGQPAMSSALARLRKHFGDPLLVREGRVYRLSAQAESLVVPVRELVAAADALLGVRTPFDPATARRTFTVMTSDYVIMMLLNPLLAGLMTEAPGIRLNVVRFADDFEERLRRASVDLLICPMQLAGALDDLPRARLFEESFVLVGDPANPDLHGEVDADRFRRLRFAGNPAVIGPQLEAQGMAPDLALTVESHVLIPVLLRGTRLVSLVQERLARQVGQRIDLSVHPSPVPLQPMVEALHWTTTTDDDPAHRWLRTKLIAQAREL